MKAHSGINEAKRGFVGLVDVGFEASNIPNKIGHPVYRDTDSEHKILSNLANSLDDNYKAKGKVTIFTELPPCASCRGTADQFMERYPNIEVTIQHNNGIRIPPSLLCQHDFVSMAIKQLPETGAWEFGSDLARLGFVIIKNSWRD